MNKIEGQNQIFEMIKNKYKEQGYIKEDEIYDILSGFGFSEEEKQLKTRKFLFKTKIKTRGLIVDSEDISFLTLPNLIDDNELLDTAIKLYIPVPAKNLEKTYRIFREFLRDNNIESNSKARNRVSNDDIVLRLTNKKDLELVRNFVRNNPKIRDVIKFTNPFFVHDDLNIGYSMDGIKTSSNGVLASHLEKYVNNSNIDEISREGFKKYLHDSKTKYYERFPKSSILQIESERIASLLALSMDEEFSFSDMITYYTVIKENNDIFKEASPEDIIKLIKNELGKIYGYEEASNMMTNIDELDESVFRSSTLNMISKVFLTNEIINIYNSKNLNQNNKKNI